MDLEPFTLPFAENKIPQTNKKMFFSIIIPSYNNGEQLINTLKNLALQNYPRDEYEITVVDDGSADNTRKALRDFMNQYPSLNLKAVHFPRVIERTAGDARFRAGLARNLGVKRSAGKYWLFWMRIFLSRRIIFGGWKKNTKKRMWFCCRGAISKPMPP